MNEYNDNAKEAIASLYTIRDILRWTASKFSASNIFYGHGSDNPWDEALRLVLPILSLPLVFPENMYSSRLTTRERSKLVNCVLRRVNERIPTSYLTKKGWLCGLEFYVDERVIIPRSPIGELIKNRFRNVLSRTPKKILDLCTGSGCIAIAIAYAYPNAEIDAVDTCDSVLEVAEYNIQTHGVEQKVIPIRSDLFNNVPSIRYDLIIANPPYVSEKEVENLPPEYQAEPILGLVSGKDGLTCILRILASASDYLNENGVLICEVGHKNKILIEQYPNIPFHWIKLRSGGEGVFMLTRTQLIQYHNLFQYYRY